MLKSNDFSIKVLICYIVILLSLYDKGSGEGAQWSKKRRERRKTGHTEKSGHKGKEKKKQGKNGTGDTAEHRRWLKDKPMGRQGERSGGGARQEKSGYLVGDSWRTFLSQT